MDQDDTEGRAARLAALVDDLAARFRTFKEMQEFRAFLLWEAFHVPRATIAMELGLYRGKAEGYIERGRALRDRAVREGVITREEMIRWLREAKEVNHGGPPDSPPGSARPAQLD